MQERHTASTVSVIHPQAWEHERRIVEITQPIPASEWTQKVTQPGDEPQTLPYDSLAEEGRYADDSTYVFAVPPKVILLLEGMLPDDQYHKLLERTPSLVHVAVLQSE